MTPTEEMVRVAQAAYAFDAVRQARLGGFDNRTEAMRAALTAALAAMWQPIETAPKDETWVLVTDTRYPNSTVSMARWEDNRYAARPQPYWSFIDERVHGITLSRKNQPTRYMPLPPAPTLLSTRTGSGA